MRNKKGMVSGMLGRNDCYSFLLDGPVIYVNRILAQDSLAIITREVQHNINDNSNNNNNEQLQRQPQPIFVIDVHSNKHSNTKNKKQSNNNNNNNNSNISTRIENKPTTRNEKP
uniref:Uncharacterized protein n=1 Tax=Glossina pallidipes TaxID=7398 RepID=A0A1A9ZQ70_GLOPL